MGEISGWSKSNEVMRSRGGLSADSETALSLWISAITDFPSSRVYMAQTEEEGRVEGGRWRRMYSHYRVIAGSENHKR